MQLATPLPETRQSHRPLLPAAPVGTFSDEELLALLGESQQDPQQYPRGELRFFSEHYKHVCVLVLHHGIPRWIPLLAPDQRSTFLKRLRPNPPGAGLRSWSRLLHCIDRMALRWYPYAFDGAAFRRNEPVKLYIGEQAWEGSIRTIDFFPSNGYAETTYMVEEVHTTSIYACEHQLWRLPDGDPRRCAEREATKEPRQMNASRTSSSDLTAFCVTCPLPSDVSAFLERLGFQLSFEMEADTSPAYEQLPTLPSQFHYVDTSGTGVIFLAGFDHQLENGVQYPLHASRFWVYRGNDGGRFGQTLRALAGKWSLRWQCSELVDKPSRTQRNIA